MPGDEDEGVGLDRVAVCVLGSGGIQTSGAPLMFGSRSREDGLQTRLCLVFARWIRALNFVGMPASALGTTSLV